ncbi:unnamed protein product [Discula destructiva]
MSLPSVFQLRAQLQAHALPPPSETWLQTLISSRNPPPPLPSLVMTAKTRLLAADLTTPGLLDSTAAQVAAFPTNAHTPTVKEFRLASDVYVQVVDIENLSRSRWDQVEELDAIERGEQTRGREVVRLPYNNNGNEPAGTRPPESTVRPQADAAAAARNATHRLVVQDCTGQKLFGLELVRMPEINIGNLNIGAKILLKKGTLVARGAVLLEPTSVQFLGGKIEAWQKAWLDTRSARLAQAIATEREG